VPLYKLVKVKLCKALEILLLGGLFLGLFHWASAQSASGRYVLVLIPARGESTESERVDLVVARLKAERRRLTDQPGDLPILRLDPERKSHASVLRELEIEVGDKPKILLCNRAESGWPHGVVGPLSPKDNLVSVIANVAAGKPLRIESKKQPTAKPPADPRTHQVGLVLYYDPSAAGEKILVDTFLKELGRHWLERYGRVEPAPFPLASYNRGDQLVASRLKESLPALGEASVPVAALCLFQGGAPNRVLEVFRELELPATLVRRISGARTRHLSESVILAEEGEVPEPAQLALSREQEYSILQSRLHEMARQLWKGVDDGESDQNRLSRKLLLQIVELTRSGKPLDEAEQKSLRAALEDYLEEPLLLSESSEYGPIQERLLELARSLLR